MLRPSIRYLLLIMSLIAGVVSAGLWMHGSTGEKMKRGVSSLMYFKDDSQTLLARDIQNLPDSVFTDVTGTDLNLGFYGGNVWMIATMKGLSSDDRTFLEIKNPLLNVVEFYEMSKSGLKVLKITGDNYRFSSREFPHRNFLYPMRIDPEEARTLLINVSSYGEQLMLPLRVWNSDELKQRDDLDLLIRGGYYGLIAFVLFFNLFIFLMIREVSSLWYLLYNFTLLLLQLSLSGHAFFYLWPNSPWLANVVNPFTASISVFALVRFTQSFLNLRDHFPGMNRLLTAVGSVLVANAGIALTFTRPLFDLSIVTVNGIALLLNIVIIPIAWKVYRLNFKPAKFFMIAFVILVITVFGFVLTNFGFLRNEFFADYGLLMGSSAEVILLTFAIVDRFKTFRDDSIARLREINRLQADSNAMLEVKVTERTRQIELQKQEIEYQKDELISSIRYARRIQENLLPSEDHVQHILGESFVFFQPKDIVSGDFYWVHRPREVRDLWSIFSVGDCTGHGVPGAFMGVLGLNSLEQLIHECDPREPGVLLDKLNEAVLQSLASDNHNSTLRDGMDIMIGAIEYQTMRLHYSGANQRLAVIRNGELIDLRGDRQAIGQHGIKPFGTHQFVLRHGDIIYAYTDGFKDQFGGINSRKLMSRGFLDVLSRCSTLPISEQKKFLQHALDAWRGDHQQLDDICVLGLRISRN